jgi:hypothetical protein
MAVRAIRDRRAIAATRKSADDVDLQRKENERLRAILARERYERIHRVANARKDAVSRTLSPLQPHPHHPRSSTTHTGADDGSHGNVTHSPKRSNLVQSVSPTPLRLSRHGTENDDSSPVCSTTPTTQQTSPPQPASATDTLMTSPLRSALSPSKHHQSVAPHNRSKLLAPLHPLAIDQAAVPGKSQRYWERKVDSITTKEHDARSKVSIEERHNFLLIRRVMRLLREEEQKKVQHRSLAEKQGDARELLFLDEIKGRIRAVALRDKMYVDGIVSPFESGSRSHVVLEERNGFRFLYNEFKKEMRLWRAVECRQLKERLVDRELITMEYNEGRLQIVKEAASNFESVHDLFSVGRDAIRQAHTQHGLSLLDDKRRKRVEALEAENMEEKVKRQQRQKIVDAKLNEEKKLHASWSDWELLRSRVVYAEQELWGLLMRMFRAELATVRNLAKLQRVEGYCYDALKEMPTVTLTQLLNTAPSSAYISQIAPLAQHTALRTEKRTLIPGQTRQGMETVASFLEPIRRDREDLPKYLKPFMEDETCPLFVGSYITTGGGMFVDPSVDFSIDMGETWGARLLVCWSYAKEESEKLGKQIIRRMMTCMKCAEKLIYVLGPESSTFRKAQSKKSFVRTRSSKSLDTNRTELLSVSLQDIAVTVPRWVEVWREMLKGELEKVRRRFPNVPLPEPGPGSSPWQAALAAQAAGDAPAAPTGKVLVSPTLHLDSDRPIPGSLLTFSTGPTPTETSLIAGGAAALSSSFVLDVGGLQQLQAPLVDMKAAKERLISAVVSLDALRVSGDVFSDSLPHFPCLSIDPSELEELHSIHSEATIDVHRQQSPWSLQVRIKPKKNGHGASSFVSSYVVRDLVRLVRLHLRDQVDEWSIPKEGVTVSVRVRVRCTLTAVSSSVSISDAASLNELLEDILACTDVVDHESDEVMECFLLPFQLLPVPLPETADEDIPEHDCRTNKPFALCQQLTLRLMPRLERHEEITTEIEGWDEEVQNTSFCFTSRRSSVAMPSGVDGIAQGSSDANRSPLALAPSSPGLLAGSPMGSPGMGPFILGSPKSPVVSPTLGKKVPSLKKEIVRRRTAIVIPNNGECLTACEAKGLEVTFSMFDGVSLHDKLILSPCDGTMTFSSAQRTKGIFWEEKAFGEGSAVLVDGVEVASAMQQLCSLRISFLPFTPTAVVERVCRSVAIHCGQYTSRIGIRVIQIVLSRPYDKIHAPSTSRWVAPSAAYVAVKITATDTPPTFTLPQRICYRGAFSGGAGSTNSVKSNTPRATQLQQQAAEASKLWRVEPKKLAIGKDAVVEDPDTQFFKGGFMTIDVRSYEPGDHVALDLREFDTECGIDGVRMQFIDDPQGQLADEMPLAWNAWTAAYAAVPPAPVTSINSNHIASLKADKKSSAAAAAPVDKACALLSFHGDAIGILAVEFHSAEGPAKLSRRQSALWGDTAAGATSPDPKVSSSSVLRRRKSSVSFQVTPSGARIPALLPPSQLQQQHPQQHASASQRGNQIPGLSGGQVFQSIEFDDERGNGEPEVQKPLSSLQGGQHEAATRQLAKGEDTPFTSDDSWRQTSGDDLGVSGNAASNDNANDTAAIEGISKLRIFFDQRVPFEAIQFIVRNLVYYRGTLLVPSGETLVDITIAPGQTIECFDVHGDMVLTGDEDDADSTNATPPSMDVVMMRTIIVERSPPLLSIAEKDRTTTYVENSGARRLFAKIAPFPSDVVAFEGGYLRVEICQDDLEDEDEIILDVPLEKMRRIFLKLDMLQEHLPDTLGSNRITNGKKSLSASSLRTSDNMAKASVESHVDMRTKVARERAMSLRVIDSTPREPPSHNGPPVAVSALRRLGSMKRGKAGAAAAAATASGLETVGSGASFSPSWSPQDGAMPKTHRSPLPFVGLDPPPAIALPVAIEAQSAKTANLWGRVRKDVSAAATAHRFLASTTVGEGGAQGGGNRSSSMYSKVFDLVRQSASSHVLVRRMEELERYGIDDTFVYRMQQNDVAQGLQAVAISTSSAPPMNATAPSVTSPTSVKSPGSNASFTPPPSPPPPQVVAPVPQLPSATVCCLADFDDNSLGTLFTRHGCISIAFDALLPSIVLKGHTLPVQPQAVIQKLLSCLAFRSTSRNPSILQKRITLTLVHPVSGRTMVFLKLNIDPVDDPTEITTLKPHLSIRSRTTEEEPYSEAMMQSIWAQRTRHGVHFAMPESSIATLVTLSDRSSGQTSGSAANVAACVPRWGMIPLLPSWSTTVFDPDTVFWDGGRIELHTSHVTLDGANFTSKVTPGMRQQLQSSLRLLTAPEQRELRGYILKYGLGTGGGGEVPPESQPSAKWVLHTRQAQPGTQDLSILIEQSSGGASRVLATLKFSEDTSDASTLLLSVHFSDELVDGEKWVTVDMIAAVLNSICVERADALRLVEVQPMNTSATTASTIASNVPGAQSSLRNSYVFPIHIRVWDPLNPKCGEATVSLELNAPMVSWPQCMTDSVPGSPHEDPSPTSSAKERRLSLPTKTTRTQEAAQQFTPEGDFIVYTSLRELTAVQGEACFQALTIRIPDKDRVGGGFLELIPLSGHRPEDRFTVLPPSNQMVITTDGVITSKEGNLGRIYGNNNSSSAAPYLRVDLAGYWFEGSKKLSYNASKQDLLAPPGIDPSTGGGRISTYGGIAWSRQVSSRVSGKRLTTLIRSIYFRTETPDGVGVSTLVGTRRFVLNISDGRYDVFGRLEVMSIPLVIQVNDGPLPKF